MFEIYIGYTRFYYNIVNFRKQDISNMNDKIIIMGIDPGINNTGICILKLNKKNNEISLVDRFVIKANETAKKQNKDDAREYGNVFSLVVYEKEMLELFNKYNPDFVACEDAFYSPRTPNAFVSLKLCINAIQRVLYQHFRKQLYKIPPKLAKSAVSQGTAGVQSPPAGQGRPDRTGSGIRQVQHDAV